MCDIFEEFGKAVTNTWNAATGTVKQIISNPMPFVTMAAATWVLGPAGTGLVSASVAPVLAAGTIAASQGRNIGEIAKSSLLAYGGSNFAGATGVGDITNYVGSQIGGTAGSITAAGLNNAFFNSTVAAVGGKDVGQAFRAGFVGGAAGAAAAEGMTSEAGKSFFGDIKESFGLSNAQMKYIQGATLATSTAALSGQDPTTALSNYIAQNISNYGKKEFNEFLDSAKKSYQDLSSSGETLKTSQENYESVKSQYDNKLSEAEKLRQSINEDNSSLQSLIDEKYTPFKTQYDQFGSNINAAKEKYDAWKASYDVWMEYYNRYAPVPFWGKNEYMNMLVNGINDHVVVLNDQSKIVENNSLAAQKLYEDNKPLIDDLNNRKLAIDKKVADFQTFRSDIENPNQDGTNLAAKFLAASNDLQSKFDQFTTSKQNVDEISKQYITKLADIGSNEEAAQVDAQKQEQARQEALAEEARQQAAALEAQRQAEAARQAEEERRKAEEQKPPPVEPEDKPPPVEVPGENGGTLTVDPKTGAVDVQEPAIDSQPPGAVYDIDDTDIGSEIGSETVTTSPGEEPLADLSKSGVMMPDGSFKTWAELDELAGVPPGTIYTDGGSTITQQELQDILNHTYTPKGTTPTTPAPKPTTPKPTTTQPTTQPVTKPTTQPVAQPAQQSNPLGMLALLDILGQPQQQQQTQQPQQQGADIKLMENIFGTDFTTPRPEGTKKYSSGGEIEALLHLLRS